MMKLIRSLRNAAGLLPALCSAGFPLAAAEIVPDSKPPATTKFYGVTVTDNYAWLEDATDPAVRVWTESQNQQTRSYLDKLPVRIALEEQLEELYEETAANFFALQYRTGQVFALKFKPPTQQPVLVSFKSIRTADGEKSIVNPNKLNTNGTTSIDWYVPSLNGKLVAVCLSEKGSEEGTLHFFESASGKQLKDTIPRVQFPTGGGSAAWNADGSGVFYTRYPEPGERPAADAQFHQQIWFHQLGTPVTQDRYELGRDFPRIAEVTLEADAHGRFIMASVANGDGGDYAHFVRPPAGAWRPVTRFTDAIKLVRFGRHDDLYLLSLKNSPRGKILRVPLATPDLAHAKLIIKETDAVIESFEPSATGLYVKDIIGGPSQIRFFHADGAYQTNVPIREVSSVDELVCRRDDELLFRNTSYLRPFRWDVYDPETNKVHHTALAGSSPVEFNDAEVVREFAVAKDGVKIPLNIIRRKGIKLNGQHPVLLTGYGGFGISLSPDFDFTRRLWLDAGGVLAIANLRGGGEYGEQWHEAGKLTRKQNVFGDFAACAYYLIRSNYTNPRKLAVEGGSNGGLLMGAFLTQHPDLARAVVAHVGRPARKSFTVPSSATSRIPPTPPSPGPRS
ncbi:MAG: prolyl oligopeptidase family serine peptidase [Acidobacteria bacterium]|nr:prolyl oligopeptidase family serine peptidase [Acidobacteriota bacterium]